MSNLTLKFLETGDSVTCDNYARNSWHWSWLDENVLQGINTICGKKTR